MLDKLVEILKKQSGSDQKTIVFCNSVKSCTWAANHLVVNGIRVAKYHGGIHPVVSPLLCILYMLTQFST